MNIFFELSKVNWLAVFSITIISFPLGALWHSNLLFGNAWKEDAKPVIDKANKTKMVTLFGLSAILHFIAIMGLATIIGNSSSITNGLLIGLITSITLVTSSIGVTHLFAGRSMRLILIDACYYIVLFSVAGLIIGLWH